MRRCCCASHCLPPHRRQSLQSLVQRSVDMHKSLTIQPAMAAAGPAGPCGTW